MLTEISNITRPEGTTENIFPPKKFTHPSFFTLGFEEWWLNAHTSAHHSARICQSCFIKWWKRALEWAENRKPEQVDCFFFSTFDFRVLNFQVLSRMCPPLSNGFFANWKIIFRRPLRDEQLTLDENAADFRIPTRQYHSKWFRRKWKRRKEMQKMENKASSAKMNSSRRRATRATVVVYRFGIIY